MAFVENSWIPRIRLNTSIFWVSEDKFNNPKTKTTQNNPRRTCQPCRSNRSTRPHRGWLRWEQPRAPRRSPAGLHPWRRVKRACQRALLHTNCALASIKREERWTFLRVSRLKVGFYAKFLIRSRRISQWFAKWNTSCQQPVVHYFRVFLD